MDILVGRGYSIHANASHLNSQVCLEVQKSLVVVRAPQFGALLAAPWLQNWGRFGRGESESHLVCRLGPSREPTGSETWTFWRRREWSPCVVPLELVRRTFERKSQA